jgi:hypothetical protein
MKKRVEKKGLFQKENNLEQNSFATFENEKMNASKSYCVIRKKTNQVKFLSTCLMFGIFASLLSCSSPSEDVKNAKEDVANAKISLDKAQEKYLADVEQFKKEINKQTIENEKEIAKINEKIKKSKSEKRSEYENQIVLLEKKNKEMKMKMNTYKADAKENWNDFKTEFNSDMKALGEALENFVTENK